MKKPLRLLPVSLSLVAAVALAGCSDSDDTGSTSAVTATPTATPQESVTPDSTAEADAVFGTAIRTAEDAVEGSVAVDYDRDDDTIDIHVVAGDVEHDIELSADGTEVLSQEQDDTLDGDDLAEVRAASVLITDAVATALAQNPGTVENVELEEEDGTVRWEIEIASGGNTTELYVDAASGEHIG